VLLAAALVLTGCVSGLHSNVPARQTYLLNPPIGIGSAAASSGQGSLRVLSPVAAPGLGTDAIAAMRPGARLDFYLGARWAAPAPAMLQSLAIDALRASRRFALVEPEDGPFPADHVLSLELRHFEARYDEEGPPTIHVTLIASYGRRNTGAMGESISADSEVRASDNRMRSVAAAFEQATAAALGKVVSALAAMPPD
jgi:cholesterol transport system auxiliary component